MSHIIVQNKGELPVWGMRLMGLSNKNAEQIGQFGTGLKESIALMARMGLEPIIFSGELRMDFSVQKRNRQDEICFMLSQEKDEFDPNMWYGMCLSPELGKADWNDPWMVFREIICNALDESGVDDLYHDVTSEEPKGVAGATRVYLPVNPDMMEAYATIHRRLLPLGDFTVVSFDQGVGKALGKRKEKTLQVFHRGVWIQQHDKESLWDYELDDLKLNESRSADWHDVGTAVCHIMARYSTAQVIELLDALINNKERDIYENELVDRLRYYVDLESKNWQEAWVSMFGEDAVLTDDSQFHYDKLKAIGKKPVVVTNSGLRETLKEAGIQTVTRVLTREQRRWEDVVDPTPEAQALFDQVWDMLRECKLTRDVEKPPLRLFIEPAGRPTMTFGAYQEGKCYVNTACIGSQQERRAYIEEIGHHVTKAHDASRELQGWLLEVSEFFMFGPVLAEEKTSE